MDSLQLIPKSFFDYAPAAPTINANENKAPTQFTLGLLAINVGTKSGHIVSANSAHIVSANSEDTVEKFKKNVANQLNVPFNQLTIYYFGAPLKDDGKSIGSHGIDMNTKLLATLASN